MFWKEVVTNAYILVLAVVVYFDECFYFTKNALIMILFTLIHLSPWLRFPFSGIPNESQESVLLRSKF